MKKFLPIIIVVLFAVFIFSFKLLSNPPSLETDEGSIAYNSALISKNLRDQNNRFLPFFILSSDKIDWKQPVLIYTTAIFFKIFGISLTVYKLINVFISLTAVILFFYLLKIIFKDYLYATIGTLALITTPIVIITTRIGNESILPLFFSTLWLLSLLLFRNKKQFKFIIINALTLGIGFYSFKGMRIIIPVWTIISCFFIFFQNIFDIKSKNLFLSIKKTLLSHKFLTQIITFILIIVPFFLIIPILENKYAGSIFDHQTISVSSVHSFFFYWLSNLSLPFWFTTPDIGKIYLIEPFGAILLTVLPFFIIGIIESVKKKSIYSFILLCFISTPILFSVAHSINYTHRLIASIPFIIIIFTFGIKSFFEKIKKNKNKKIIFSLLIGIFLIDFFTFFRFYYFKYPKLNTTKASFGQTTYTAFKLLAKESQTRKLIPYVQESIYKSEGDENNFYNIAYFNNSIKIWKLGDSLPSNVILLTQNGLMEKFNKLDFKNLPSDLNILVSQ